VEVVLADIRMVFKLMLCSCFGMIDGFLKLLAGLTPARGFAKKKLKLFSATFTYLPIASTKAKEE
jgi:hypothetical protein